MAGPEHVAGIFWCGPGENSIFMHAKYSSRLTKLIIATGFFFLLVLFTLTLTDYLSRGWRTAPTAAAATRAG